MSKHPLVTHTMNLIVLCLTVLAALPIAMGAGRYPEDMWQGHMADQQDQASSMGGGGGGGARRASRRGGNAVASQLMTTEQSQPVWNDYTQSYNSVMGQNQGGYDHQDSDAYSYSGDLSSFERGAGEDGSDVDTLSSARQLRKSQKQRLLLRQQQQQQMSEIDDTESQLSAFGGLSLAGQMGSESEADSVFSINIRPGGAMGGASTARLPRGAGRKGKGSSFLAGGGGGGASDSGAEPQSARVRRPSAAGQSRRGGVQGGETQTQLAGGVVSVDQQVNDPRLWQLFNKVWAGHHLDFQVDPKDLAVNVMRIRHALECPEAIERIAYLKVQNEAPQDEKNYLGAYVQWMEYWKKAEAKGWQILTTAESNAIKAQMGMAGAGAGGSGEHAGGGGAGGSGARRNESSRQSSGTYDYAPLVESDSVNKSEARAVWSVFRQNQLENAFPGVPSKGVSIADIEDLSWGLKVADFGRDKTEALLRMFLEKAVKRSQEELAEFDAARMLRKQDWEAQVQAKKEEVLRRGTKSRKGRS